MIAADSSSLIAYLSGDGGFDIDLIEQAMGAGSLRLPPPVITELLSRPKATDAIDYLLTSTPALEIDPGLWQRAGEARRTVLTNGNKAALADALVAQCCIDADVALITRDSDFRHFARLCGLKLAG